MKKNKAALSGVFLIAALLGITMLYGSPENQPENTAVTNFQSEQEFIDYMSGDDRSAEAYRSADQDLKSASGKTARPEASDASGEMARSSTQEAEWVHATEGQLLISHRYPRRFTSVNIPGLELEHNISDAGGPMVATDNLTVIDERDRIAGYDSDMEEEWEIGLNSSVDEMTRSGDQLIVLTRETDFRCPVRPFEGAAIACTSILRPDYMGQNDYTYTLSRIDIESGEQMESVSFVASSTAQIEVTPEKTYVSYSDRKPENEIMADFILNEASVSSETRERVKELQGYDLTDRSMQIEIEAAIRKHEKDNRKALEKEFSEYDREHMRSYEESTLLTFNNSDLSYSEQSFNGRVSEIESENDTLLSISYRGMNYSNRADEIKILGGGSTEIEGEAQLFNDKILVRDDSELKLLDRELNELNSVHIQALNVETSGNRVLASVRPEGGEKRERESSLILFDSDLERLDSKELDSWGLYSFNLVEAEESSFGLVHGYNSTYLMEAGDEINLRKTEASGQLIYQEGLYTAGEKVQKLSENGDIEDEIDLKISRNYIPLPGPMVR